MAEALHVSREKRDGADRKLVFKSKDEDQECCCIQNDAPSKRWVTCDALCSQINLPPQPFSLTCKGAQGYKVKVKIKKNVLAVKVAALE